MFPHPDTGFIQGIPGLPGAFEELVHVHRLGVGEQPVQRAGEDRARDDGVDVAQTGADSVGGIDGEGAGVHRAGDRRVPRHRQQGIGRLERVHGWIERTGKCLVDEPAGGFRLGLGGLQVGGFGLGEHLAHADEFARLDLARAGQLLDQRLGRQEPLLLREARLAQLPPRSLREGLRHPRLAGIELPLGPGEGLLPGQRVGIREGVVLGTRGAQPGHTRRRGHEAVTTDSSTTSNPGSRPLS
nr:hypothetical protein BJQ95_01555 [Cryobacterium sp. SO1]